MKRSISLKGVKNFRIVYSKGKRFYNDKFRIVVYKVDESNKNLKGKIGISVNKKVRKAVIRNKIKRRIKSIITHYKPFMDDDYAIIIYASSRLDLISFNDVKRALLNVFRKSGVLK